MDNKTNGVTKKTVSKRVSNKRTGIKKDAKPSVKIKNDSQESISFDDLNNLKRKSDLYKLLDIKDNRKAQKLLKTLKYEEELMDLQVELIKMQHYIQNNNKRVAVIFEGRDAAGKGGTIRRFTEHMNPRALRVVALPKPTETELGQWYFQRYINQLPNPGEIVFFDRSWYNRAVVEPVMGFCTKKQYKQFMQQVTEFEHMLYEDGIIVIKLWFSISKDEQLKRFTSRLDNPLKQWKISPVDKKAQDLWDEYSKYKDLMFANTHTTFSPWILVRANSKKTARLESIKYVLNKVPYKSSEDSHKFLPDPNIVGRYTRKMKQMD